jgi:hypothetical protein
VVGDVFDGRNRWVVASRGAGQHLADSGAASSSGRPGAAVEWVPTSVSQQPRAPHLHCRPRRNSGR